MRRVFRLVLVAACAAPLVAAYGQEQAAEAQKAKAQQQAQKTESQKGKGQSAQAEKARSKSAPAEKGQAAQAEKGKGQAAGAEKGQGQAAEAQAAQGEKSSAQADGQQTYSQVCSSCHDTGTSGAPKITDTAAWEPRIKQGKETLYKHAIQGIGAMPPKGGQPSLSESDVQGAVDYMVAQASGSGGGQQTTQAAARGGMPSAEELITAPVSALQIMPAGAPIKNPYAGDKESIAAGKFLFSTMNCVGCHAPEAGGGMGPALTDNAWVYGDQPADIYLTITHGRPNGMPAYGTALPARSIWNLVSYVETLR